MTVTPIVRRWILPPLANPAEVTRLRADAGVSAFLAEILIQRGIARAGDCDAFLHPALRSLSAPELLPGMSAAVERLLQAIDRGERVVLYGDYDVDGISSLAIMHRVLAAFGLDAPCFLPLRREEGYGLSEAGLARCVEIHRPRLVVAIDCGTTSTREIQNLRDRGVETIVLDHHEPGPSLPPAVALVNPKLGADFHHLCSGGVVFKVAHALQKARRQPDLDLRDFLDLVALATIADIVPLTGENRVFVAQGLARMSSSKWVGIEALRRVSGVASPVRPSDVGFRMGPRINAAGRLGPANEALQLLLTDDAPEAARLAGELDLLNRARQTVERDVAAAAESWARGHFDPACHRSIVTGSRDWHIGVLGVVASRLMRQFHRPTFIIGFDADGNGKGSGRSIEGLPLVELLSGCADHLEKFGGHHMAAGISLHESRLGAFREAFESAVVSRATEEVLTPRIRLDAEISLEDVDEDLLAAQDRLQPFGCANAQPVLLARGVRPAGTPREMKEKHVRLDLECGRRPRKAVYFNMRLAALPRPPWDVAFTLDWNEWQGRAEPQMNIVAIRSSQ